MFKLLLASVAIVCSAAEPVVLTDESYSPALAGGGAYFVKYYAPWCGHCKRLAPVWDELSEAVDAALPVKIAKVDCTTAKDTCSAMGIRGYPTLIFHKEGDATGEKYTGARTLEAMKEFAESQVKGA